VSADLAPYRDEWERLYASRPHEPSVSFEWTAALFANHLETGDQAFIVRVRRAGETLALAPLVVRRLRVAGCPLSLLAPLADRYNTHSDVLASALDDELLAVLAEALFRLPVRWDVFRLSNVLEGHPLARIGPLGARKALAWSRQRHGYASYVLDLPATFDEYLAGRSAKFRSHFRRTVKKVEAASDARVEVIEAPGDVDEAYALLLEVERASWKHEHGTAITAVPRQLTFYETVCRGAAARGHLHFQVLRVGGAAAAYNLGYLRDGVYAYLKTSYAQPYRELGVAAYLRGRLIENLITRGVRRLDFPAEPYEWERQWTDAVRWHTIVTINRSTPAGVAWALADRLKHGAGERRLRFVDPRGRRASG
jgi:CelD/BcsL family acetyltransferase involved in cellulose biosynthesis